MCVVFINIFILSLNQMFFLNLKLLSFYILKSYRVDKSQTSDKHHCVNT